MFPLHKKIKKIKKFQKFENTFINIKNKKKYKFRKNLLTVINNL